MFSILKISYKQRLRIGIWSILLLTNGQIMYSPPHHSTFLNNSCDNSRRIVKFDLRIGRVLPPDVGKDTAFIGSGSYIGAIEFSFRG